MRELNLDKDIKNNKKTAPAGAGGKRKSREMVDLL